MAQTIPLPTPQRNASSSSSPDTSAVKSGPLRLPQPAGDPLAELQHKADEASGNFGRGLAQWERGELSAHELGVLKRREGAARKALDLARWQDHLARSADQVA